MTQTNELLNEAQRAAQEAETWADLSNFLFNPIDGLVARAYPTREAREHSSRPMNTRRSAHWSRRPSSDHGLVDGATPRKSGGSWSGCPSRCTRHSSERRPRKGSA